MSKELPVALHLFPWMEGEPFAHSLEAEADNFSRRYMVGCKLNVYCNYLILTKVRYFRVMFQSSGTCAREAAFVC